MSSRHRHKRSHSRDSRKEASPSKRRKSSEKQDKLDAILASLSDLKSDISSCNARICEIEAKNAVFEAVFRTHPSPAEHAVEENTDDQLSFVAGNEFNDDINEDVQALDTSTEPPHTVNKPPNKAIKPTNSPHAMSPVDGQIHTDESAGPLCSLHDRLKNNFDLNPSEIKLVVEQALCLLGSTNNQLSVLRRKKVLASVNKSKIELAN